ncbi:MAG: isoprenylcysteine carboxylmethyltransferase family protein [Gemmatimonadota bacterium]|nr:MAG: isoprenylcysteine carboxylmethyltransferase family protein [Gemmatimonadota bacterium]
MKNSRSSEDRSAARSKTASTVLKTLVAVPISLALMGALLFLPAGGLDWPNAWAWLAVLILCLAINIAVLIPVNPEVIEERSRIGKGVKRWDIIVSSVMTMFVLGTVIVAGLDHRHGWSPRFSLGLLIAGGGLMLLGDLLLLWAMAVNKFFSKLVRIQRERGHHVVTTGPYRFVRHPGYVGWIVMWIGSTLIFGSLWAFVPTVLASTVVIVRTALEDKTLHEELAGYGEYAGRVRHKLVPGVW